MCSVAKCEGIPRGELGNAVVEGAFYERGEGAVMGHVGGTLYDGVGTWCKEYM